MHFTQRIAFGPRSAADAGTDLEVYVAQLADAGPRVGIRSLADGPIKVVPWPACWQAACWQVAKWYRIGRGLPAAICLNGVIWQ